MEHNSADLTIEIEKEARRIDRWVAYVATRPWIKRGVFVVAALEATISPLLPELVVATILTYRKDLSWKLLSVISALGSATGAAVLYVVGKYLYKAHEAAFDKVLGTVVGTYSEKLFEHNTFISMFLAAFTPLPDRIMAFLSGVFELSILITLIAFFLGRLLRVGLVAYFSYKYGKEARRYVLKHTKNVTIALIILVVAYFGLQYFGIL